MKRLALLFLLAFACGSLFAATIKVPVDQPTIAAAVAAAGDNDIIAISKNPANAEGAYFENVVVPNTTTGLTFTGKVIWDGNLNGTSGICLDITGPDAGPILVQGIIFRNGTTGVRAGNGGATVGVTVTGCTGLSLSGDLAEVTGNNCTLTKNQVLFCGDLCDITGNTAIVSGNKHTQGEGGIDIVGNGALVEKNVFLNIEDGDAIDITGTTPQIISNSFTNVDGNIGVGNGSTGALFSGNKLTNVEEGLRTGADSNGSQALKNKFILCDATSIELDGTGLRVEGNSIANGTGGIRCSGNTSGADNAVVTKNKIKAILNDGIDVDGDTVEITGNSLTDLSNDANGIDLSSSGSGGGLIDKNKIKAAMDNGIRCSADGVTISNNSVSNCGGQNERGFDISGDNCDVTKNKASLCDGDGFRISGTDCNIADCTSTNNGKDGFDNEEGDLVLFNTFTNCKASGNLGEGFDNSTSTGTVVTGGSFTKNRIDMAGNTPNAATITISPETQIGDSSGAATVPEVD